MGTANEIRKADGTECTFKEFMESSVDSLNIGIGKVDGANNGTESDIKDTSSKVNGSNGGTDSDSKDVDAKVDGSNGGTDSDRTDDDPKIDGAKVGTDSESKDVKEKVNGSNGVTDSDKTDDDPKIKGGTGSDRKDADEKVDGSNGGTDSDRTGDDPKIDGAKVGTDSGSKDADAKVDGSNGGTESYSKDAVANDDREQHETEHVNTDLNDHEGVSMGEKHGNKISDIDTNFDTCMYKEKHVLVNFNGKAHVGIVKETNLSSVLVDCMRRNGKKDKNSFCLPMKIRDTNLYQLTDVIAIVECSIFLDRETGINYMKNHGKCIHLIVE
ncbi:dentin sialophosphoprotein-like [Mya arenaria]|nr:dentin sialophosphoprotein-like [Mya arenaria]